MFARMMFGGIIAQIQCTWGPINMELALADAVFDPEESHVHGFGALLFDGVVGNAVGCGIVGGERSGTLFVAKFFKGDSFRDSLLAIEKESCKFSFRSTCKDVLENFARDSDGAVPWRLGDVLEVRWCGAQVVISGGSGAGF